MKLNKLHALCSVLLLCFFCIELNAQNTVKGVIYDASNNEPIIGGNVVIKGTAEGTVTDWDGSFEFTTDRDYPFTVEVSYVGYTAIDVEVTNKKSLSITLEESVEVLEAATVKASRISDKQKESPLTLETLDALAIKETPQSSFYDGLGALKDVDLTAASLGFKVVNTRGFNSTSPVRSLQTIDGVDNQAPGLNFSLGNFLGSSELDINRVELVIGASSAFYGPNAFNGVIAMQTKDPFYSEGLSAMIKVGERNMINPALRWADKFQDEDGNDRFAYKVNLEYLRADDWVADNYDPIDASRVTSDNTGLFDAVNIYGDEYYSGNNFTELADSDPNGLLGIYYRTGYREIDLVDYDTRNLKANANFHYRLKPSKGVESPELIFANSYGTGTTVYQGDNRFSLKGITFLQNRLELRKRNKYFIRAFTTRTGAGDSYDPYFTALQLQERTKENDEWSKDYTKYWVDNVVPQIYEEGFPELQVMVDPITFEITTSFDGPGADQWIIDNNANLLTWHQEAAAFANGPGIGSSSSEAYYEPGTERFQAAFDDITGKLRSEGGTRFFDNSALYHVHGEYIFTPTWADKITVGANGRMYTPESRGTVFSDTAGVKITNLEAGAYGGIEKSFLDKKMKASVTMRMDKNQNFPLLVSPAASLVYTPSQNNFFRASFSSAIRNPTLSDQYLYLDVGRATLSGNINGVENLVTTESLVDFLNTQGQIGLDTFAIDPVAPEQVRTFELGFRTTLFKKLYLDAGYYYSFYTNFIGFQIGADFDYSTAGGGITIQELEVFRYAANSKNKVTTQGFSVGLNYYLNETFAINGNYSWNKLNTVIDDPIIPAFNTPEHKFNLGIGGRNIDVNLGAIKTKMGVNVSYKWIEGFQNEGSPQFTGFVPTYDTLKIGASNILNKQNFQTYGGPRIGRLAFATLVYEPK